jgi:hypothetical protein
MTAPGLPNPRTRPAWRASPLIGVLAVALGLGLWWFVRSGWLATWRAIADDDGLDDDLDGPLDRTLDADAVSRAATEGMGAAFAAEPMRSTPS